MRDAFSAYRSAEMEYIYTSLRSKYDFNPSRFILARVASRKINAFVKKKTPIVQYTKSRKATRSSLLVCYELTEDIDRIDCYFVQILSTTGRKQFGYPMLIQVPNDVVMF